MSVANGKVTIGIPVYNEIRFIERTIRSALGQADELFIADNASTDGTSELCQKYAAEYPEIRYVRHAENKGSRLNFDYLLENTENEYFMWLGAHDLLPRNHVKKLREILDTKDVVLAYSNAVHLTGEYVFNKFYAYKYADKLLSDNPAERVFTIIKKLTDCTLYHGLYKRSVLLQSIHDLYHDKYCGIDHGVLGEIAYNGKMKLCDDTVYYRTSPHLEDQNLTDKFTRVMRSLYSSQYNEAIHIPEMIPIGISFVLLRTAEKASVYVTDKNKYLNEVKKILSLRWGKNKLIDAYLKEHFGIRKKESTANPLKYVLKTCRNFFVDLLPGKK